jgi:GAF domain-containing protein
LTTIERQVHGAEGQSYLVRMLPYRTYDDRIAGVVLTLVDVTERERTRRELAEDLAFTERLRYVAQRVADDDGMKGLFDDIVDAAIFLTRADAGMVQLLDESRQRLRILASKGMTQEAVDRAADVKVSAQTSSGAALATRARTFVEYAADDASEREVGGTRGAQSTPLITRTGRPVGLITVYWKTEHRPTERELRFFDLLMRQAADAIERQQTMNALRTNVDELQRFNQAAVAREMRMIDLKKEVNDLAQRLGEPPPYSLDFEKNAG